VRADPWASGFVAFELFLRDEQRGFTQIFGADAALTAGSKLLLIDYTGTWNSTGFSGLADGTVFTLGMNQYRIDYDGNFSTGALTGGTDVMLTVVPEPQTALCAAIGLSVLLFRRKIKRSGI